MYPLIKRGMDVVIAGTALLLLSPLLGAVALAMWISMGRPILFRQVRPGWKTRPFRIVKFRTMGLARAASGSLLPDAQRLTLLGRWLRRMSIDELPELWNVLKGEMSLVGPRPLLTEYLQRYSPEQSRRHKVRPGITGWAQVNGRNALAWEERLALDVWYVDHHSLWLDIRILARTVRQVLAREGITHPGHATMPGFLGTQTKP